MVYEEAQSFIKEMQAVSKMLHYLPLEILEIHIVEMDSEIQNVSKLEDIKRKELTDKINVFKDRFKKEVSDREKS